MNTVFADSFFYLALLNPRDAGHNAAKAAAKAFSGRILTSQWVLLEVADAFSRPADRAKFDRLVLMLETNDQVTVIAADSAAFKRGLALYRSRVDKDWPLTDCISFILMDEHGLKEAFTEDRHFEQAGFVALLRDG